jgi:hypothetical protein
MFIGVKIFLGDLMFGGKFPAQWVACDHRINLVGTGVLVGLENARRRLRDANEGPGKRWTPDMSICSRYAVASVAVKGSPVVAPIVQASVAPAKLKRPCAAA